MTRADDRTELSKPRPVALVLGATGGIGGAVAKRLHASGYAVRAMHRRASAQALTAPDYDWVDGDAMNRGDVLRAAHGAAVIVHAVNPPGYRNWEKLVLPMIDNTIAAAKAQGARILMPGTIYNYGPDSFATLTEDSPQRPVTRKGRIRVALEQRLEAAAGESVKVILLRAGDYFGPGAAGSWFSQVMVKPGAPLKAITSPAAPGVGHQWAYLPDVAETMVRLLDRADALPAFARFHMEGVWDHDGLQLVQAIRRVSGRPDLPVRRFPWLLVGLASPFVPLFREIREIRYLWRQPLRLRNDRLVALLGAEPRTPLDRAVADTLAGLGCLGAPAAGAVVAGLLPAPDAGRGG